jgi:hypothetical protein
MFIHKVKIARVPSANNGLTEQHRLGHGQTEALGAM